MTVDIFKPHQPRLLNASRVVYTLLQFHAQSKIDRRMSRIILETIIAAPAERVFDLSRSIDFHQHTAGHTKERAVNGVIIGLIGPGEQVTWRAKHFGVWQILTVRITGFERPAHFRDEMVSGTFRQLVHDHHFQETRSTGRPATVMRDEFTYEVPLGLIGLFVDRLFLHRYLTRFLRERNQIIK